MNAFLEKMVGQKYKGKGELWLDPAGNTAEFYDCELAIEPNKIRYSWQYDNQTHEGSYTFNNKGAEWVDSWHQPKAILGSAIANTWGLFATHHEYEIPDSPNWGWRSQLSERPDGAFVLQMTNITSWGEEGRAVRMVFTRK